MQRLFPSALLLALLLAGAMPSVAFAAAAKTAPKPVPQAATAPSEIGGAKGWMAYAYSEKGAKVCYLVGRPAKSEVGRRVDAMITHRPKDNAVNVVNFDAGYPFKEGSSAELEVDGRKFSLFTDKDAAWAADSATDKTLTEALAKGHHASLKGTSARGVVVTDVYTLDGFSTALAAIDKACGVKR